MSVKRSLGDIGGFNPENEKKAKLGRSMQQNRISQYANLRFPMFQTRISEPIFDDYGSQITAAELALWRSRLGKDKSLEYAGSSAATSRYYLRTCFIV